MGRELRRKEAKKNKNNIKLKDEELDTSIKGTTLVKIVVFGLIILLVLYYIVAVFITKEISVSNKNQANQNQTANNGTTNRILAANIFNQKDDTYYVYFYDFNEEDNNINSAISAKSDLKIYRVDTSSALNNKYVTEESGNRNVTGIDNLLVKNPTIIGITNDTVTSYYEGSSEIIAFLSN